jgi:hypothetical protein
VLLGIRVSSKRMFWMTLALLGCSNNDLDAALAVCEAVPALSLDAAGRALIEDFIAPKEREIWDQSEASVGMRQIGSPAFGVIRANASCQIVGSEKTPQGLRVDFIRKEPEVLGLRVFDRHELIDQDKVERKLSLWVREGRVWVDLQRALKEAAAARKLARSGDEKGAEAAFAALYAWFPDPTLFAERGLLVLAPNAD